MNMHKISVDTKTFVEPERPLATGVVMVVVIVTVLTAGRSGQLP